MADNSFAPCVQSRRNNFDFFRFVFATLVVLAHCVPDGVGYKIGSHVLFIGSHAVDGFFTISGFLITGSWLHAHSPAKFARNRFLRIYPGLLAALLFCVLIVGPVSGASLSEYVRHWPSVLRFFSPLILGAPTGLPGVFHTGPWPYSVDGPLWTIHFEIFCYILVALLGLTGLLKNRSLLLGLFVLSIAGFAYIFYRPGTEIIPFLGDVYQLPRLICFFLAGMVFYSYADIIPRSRALAAVSVVMMALFFSKQPFIPTTFGVYLLFYLAFSNRLGFHAFAKHGDYSYGMYVYAFPVMQLILEYFGPMRPLLLFPITFVLSLVLAMLSWHFVEKPFLKRGSNRPAVAGESPLPVDEPSGTNQSGALSRQL